MSALPSGISTSSVEVSGSQLPGPHPVLAPMGDPRVLPLDRPVTLAGSGPRCRLNLRSSTVSKVHAVFVRDGGIVYVRDVASREGVKVDGELVRECLLSGGEKVEIGRFGFVFEGVLSTRMPPRAPGGTLMGVEIESRTMVIGRRNTCDVVIDKEEVSSSHAILLEHNGRRYVRDLGSRTGVLLNGHRVQWEYLKSGDVIVIGGQEMVYVEAEAVRAEPKMRLASPTGSVLMGPGGTVEQTTLLSESMNEGVEALKDEDVGVGSGMGSGVTSVAGLAGVSAPMAFDDGTEARDDDPTPKGPLPTGAAVFSAAAMPVLHEGETGAEIAAKPPEEPKSAREIREEEAAAYKKVLPPQFDPMASAMAEALEESAPAAHVENSVGTGESAQLSAVAPVVEEVVSPGANAAGESADASDDFESMMAAMDVGAVEERTYAAPAIEADGAFTLDLNFDEEVVAPTEGRGLGESERGGMMKLAGGEWGQAEETAPEAGKGAEQVEAVRSEQASEVAPAGVVSSEPMSGGGGGDAQMMERGEETAKVEEEAVAAEVTEAASEEVVAGETEAGLAVVEGADGSRQTVGGVAAAAAETRWTGLQHEPVVADRKTGAELGKLLRGTSVISEPVEESEKAVAGARVLGAVVRSVVILGLAAGAGYGGWLWAKPESVVVGKVSLPVGTDGQALLLSEGVRERAVAKLGETDPSVGAGELLNEAVLRQWSSGSSLEGGVLTVKLDGDAAQAARLKSLLAAAAEKAQPVRVLAAQAIAGAEDQRKAAAAALSAMELKLADAETRMRDGSNVAVLAGELSEAERVRDQATAKLESIRSAVPVADEAAKQKLDVAVASFQRQLEAAKAQPTADQRLSAFVQAAQSVQEQGAMLTDEILRSRQEQADRLVSLKKRLDERMRIRQQQAWDSDVELKNLNEQLESSRRKLVAAKEKNETNAIQDLTGEVEYFEGLVKSRRALVGQDKGDQRALQEVQSIIEEQALATEQDRKRLAESFEQMRLSLVRALPEAGTIPDVERQLATDLEMRLGELQAARAALADATASAISRHQDAVKVLETELSEAEAKLIDSGQALEMARQSVPSLRQIEELRESTASARRLKEEAERAVETAKTTGSMPTMAAEVTRSAGDGKWRAYYAGGAAVATLVLLSPLLRTRRREEM